MLAHSFGLLSLVADVAFCVFVKRKKKRLQEVVFSKLQKFLGFTFIKGGAGAYGKNNGSGEWVVATYR